uniref:Uncharacterized protein n=1 Tax=Periophthalmus magnuspinnatus TaxID=409849 RepID=A0A3B4BB30_9GOBI
MGAALTRAAQWTSSGSGSRTLALSPLNETLLSEMVQFVEDLRSLHPQTADVVFEEPLQWRTALQTSDLKADYTLTDSGARSEQQDSTGRPLLHLSPPHVSALSLSLLSELLDLCGDKEAEVRACLQGTSCRQCVHLHVSVVKNELDSLVLFCGDDDHSLLRSLHYTSDFEFANGCRAPPHRQLLGEVAYIRIETYDTEPVCATYSNRGVFLNKVKTASDRTPARSRLREALSESSPESEEEEEEGLERRPDTSADLPSEQLRLQKLIRFMRGNQTATLLTMCALRDMDLKQETYQLSIRDLGGLDALLNILDTGESRCIMGSLKILRVISHSAQIQRSMVRMRGVQSLVPLLDIQVPELQALAAETLANVAKFRKARRTVRHCGGIGKLVRLLDCAPDSHSLSPREELHVEAARCGALALWSCSRSSRNKEAIRKAGGIPLLGRLLRSPHVNMLIPVIGTLQECASEESYRNAIRSEGMIKDLVKNLSSENEELQMHSASAIFKCAEDEKTRDLIHQYKGPQRLALLLSKPENKQLLAAATGAIWKCSLSQKNVTKFQEFRVLEKLVSLTSEQPEEVLVNVVAALGEFAQIPTNRGVIGQSGGIEKLVRLLTGRNQALLVNVTRALGICATDMKNMAIIDQLDGLRLVWSLLKNPSPEVQSSAAWALCPIIHNGKDVGESMRRLIGGFQLLIKLLKSTDNEVLASICAVIAKITEDKEENVALLTDYGVVPLLANLTSTTDDLLRRHLAEAVAYCCMWGQNRAAFGKAGAVPPLVRYVKSKDSGVHETTVVALYQLSKDVDNCISLHSNGVVQPLLELMGHEDEDVAFMAAGCVRNIRMLANANKFSKWNN